MDNDSPSSRGFRPKQQDEATKRRLPPGQYLTTEFPVLSAGRTPQTKLADWRFALLRGASRLATWTWAKLEVLPQTTIKTDIHCVTKWPTFDTTWQIVTSDDLLKAAGLAEPRASCIMAYCDGGYRTNLRVADLLGGRSPL